MSIDHTLFKRLGGEATLERVHKIFYDKVYAHPWLKLYFTEKPQHVLEEQQTDFMQKLMGGPDRYAGKTPGSAHTHMNITEELFELRQTLLSESISEAGLTDVLRTEWLAVDSVLKRAVVKKSIKQCHRSNPSQQILDFKRPHGT